MPKIVIYTKENCPYCVKAKALLQAKKVAYEEIRIDLQPEMREEMLARANGAKTVPQIFIDDTHVGGCDDLYALEGEGRLDALLEQEPTSQPPTHRQLIILGSGPAGYTAAIYAGRANLAPLVISGPQKGGQLITTTNIDNFPGFPEGIDGNELMQRMEQQALRFDAQVEFGEITALDLSQHPFQLFQGEQRYTCDALIIATGASARYLGLESEARFLGRGVSGCATCDGFFFKGQKVAVIGGGDTAIEEATYLTHFCEKVFLVHRRDAFRASQAMQKLAFHNKKIEIVWDTVVDEVLGNDTAGMTDLRVLNLKTGEKSELGVSGMFVAIGHTPNTALFRGLLDMDDNGYLIPQQGSTRMNIPGVFAGGDARDSVYRQGITAAGTGCMAAIDAERWLDECKAQAEC